jgi:thiamine biosynthesis lipoprotein
VSRIRDGRLTVTEAHPLVGEVVEIGRVAESDGAGAFTLEPGGRFDPSGVVKGWSIERASAILLDAGLPHHLVNGGGAVQAHGMRGPGQSWRVAIADPRDRSRSVAVIGGREPLAVATSGTTERGEHVQRVQDSEVLSVTVIGDHLTDVDIAATTAFALGPAARDWIEDRPHLAAFAVLDGGRMWTSRRMQDYVVG